MMKRLLRVGITHGDINGISYEILLKTFADERMMEICTPVIFGSAKLVGYFRKSLGIEDFRYNTIHNLEDVAEGECNVYNITDEEIKVDLGQATPESAQAAIMSLQAGVEALKEGDIDLLVTCPINKENIYGEDFPYAGHTEYLEAELAEDGEKSLMILFDDFMRVALVTTHLPLREVPDAITIDKIKETARIFAESLKKDFTVECPKIAVLSLNPHCGDGGLLGKEEIEVIIPAVQQLCDEGLMVFGPFAADGFFGTGSYEDYDGVLAMYHDQGLAPFKALAGPAGVNFTAGLGYIRTSPDHGTGYDIAGRNVADPESLRQAIFKAIDIWRNRRAYEMARANPLRKQYEPHGADKSAEQIKEGE